MKWLRFVLICCFFVSIIFQTVHAQTKQLSFDVAFADQTTLVCPASNGDTVPPKKYNPACKEMILGDVDPQNSHIWVLLEINIPDPMLDNSKPLGIGVSAKASTFIYINGREVARNGRPADNSDEEIEGRMDAIFPLREGVLQAGVNEIAMRMSSFSGFLTLSDPIHSIYISKYETPQSRILRRYSSTLFPFGIFVLGALYFLTMSIVGPLRLQSALISAMSGAVAMQLFAEVSRGLFAYTYHWHDIRLIAIVLCSAVFAMSFSIYLTVLFGRPHLWKWVSLIGVTTVLALLVPSGFDAKALLILLSQIIIGLLILIFHWRVSPVRSGLFSIVLIIFAATNILAQGQFLDIYFFYIIAVLMMFLFVHQALAYSEEKALRHEESVRANTLQLILDQKEDESQPRMISLMEAGKVHRVSTDDIVYVSGADDYIEVKLRSGKTRLISSTLLKMETMLPAYFLKVHRSHIVNTNFIENLSREPSGTGLLTLDQGDTLPVSRRIMPSVRKALS